MGTIGSMQGERNEASPAPTAITMFSDVFTQYAHFLNVASSGERRPTPFRFHMPFYCGKYSRGCPLFLCFPGLAVATLSTFSSILARCANRRLAGWEESLTIPRMLSERWTCSTPSSSMICVWMAAQTLPWTATIRGTPTSCASTHTNARRIFSIAC